MADNKKLSVLNEYRLIETRDRDELQAALQPLYGDVRADLRTARDGLHAVTSFQRLGTSGIYCGNYGDDIAFKLPRVGFIAQGMTLAGSGTSVLNGQAEELSVDRLPSAVMVGDEANILFGQGHEHLAFVMDPAEVTRKLRALTGSATDQSLTIDRTEEYQKPELRHFRTLFLQLVEILSSPPPPPEPLLRELEQSLIVAFLLGNKTNFDDLLKEKPRDIAPWQVKRVEEYIAAHWDQHIDIEDLAKKIDCSVRSIYHTFRQSRGYSPMQFLRTLRLNNAHKMLSAPQNSASVTEIAYGCGFGNLGHFAKAYAKAFGELPSETLQKARGLPQRH